MQPVEETGTEMLRQETLGVYQELSGAVTAYAFRLTTNVGLAQDAVQETFLRFFLARMRGTIIRNPSAWLHWVSHNLTLTRDIDDAAFHRSSHFDPILIEIF